MKNPLVSFPILFLSVISLLTILTNKIPVSYAQTPVIVGPIIVTGNPISYPTPTFIAGTPINTQPGPSIQPAPTLTLRPTYGPTIGVNPQTTPIAGPTWVFNPTQIPMNTPTVLPTIGIAGYVPTTTTTPSFTYISFGPKGTPDSEWDTAEELLQSLSNAKTDAFEINRYLYGGWDTHIKGLPFNNFSIMAGQGYLIGVRGKKEINIDKLKYNHMESIVLNIANGWVFISIPQDISNQSKVSDTEDLCNKINKQGGKAVEIDKHPRSADASFWNIHTCGKKANNFNIQSGTGYMVKGEKYSTLNLSI